MQVGADDVALNRAVVNTTDHTFSHLLDDWAVTNQKMTGRCWMFAGLNLFRVGAMAKMGLKEFEFSQAYTLLRQAGALNYVLEAMIEVADRPLDDRTVAFLLDRPLEDGGQWNMFVNLVRKHGIVPKSFMPETESSSNTRRLNGILWYKLREGARTLRERRAMGGSMRTCARRRPGCWPIFTASSASTSGHRRRRSSGSGPTRTAPSTATR